MHKLKKALLMVVGQALAPDELEGLRQLFASFDADASGAITVREMRKALQSWGQKISEVRWERVAGWHLCKRGSGLGRE